MKTTLTHIIFKGVCAHGGHEWFPCEMLYFAGSSINRTGYHNVVRVTYRIGEGHIVQYFVFRKERQDSGGRTA